MPVTAAAILLALVTAQLGETPAPANSAVIPHCFVFLADQADLPPGEPGKLEKIMVQPGDEVKAGQLLLQVDDHKEQQELIVAMAKLKAARVKASDDINIRYAVASLAVAKKTADFSEEANRKVKGSIPFTQIEELKLKVTEAELSIDKARKEKDIAGADAEVAEAEVKAAKVAIDHHQVVSPIDGVVVEVRKHLGEWVQPSDPVVKIVNLKKLWVEGYAPTAQYRRSEMEKCDAYVDVVVTRGQKKRFPAKVIFVKPTTDTGDSFLVRAEVENVNLNGSWLLSPGLPADMAVQLNTTIAERN
jgi:multidrug efflux pump subunit AcrA (membrane-fusion protein)